MKSRAASVFVSLATASTVLHATLSRADRAPSEPRSTPAPAEPALDQGGLIFGAGAAPAIAPGFGSGWMGMLDIGGGFGGRRSPTGHLLEAGIGIPVVLVDRSQGPSSYAGSAFSIWNRITWRRGPFEIGARLAPIIRFARYGVGDKETDTAATQLGIDASPEVFYRVTREFWFGVGLDHLISFPTFEGTSGLPFLVVGPMTKLVLIPFN